jgi:hypothetical protein
LATDEISRGVKDNPGPGCVAGRGVIAPEKKKGPANGAFDDAREQVAI